MDECDHCIFISLLISSSENTKFILVLSSTLQMVQSKLIHHHFMIVFFRNSKLGNGQENQKDTSWFDQLRDTEKTTANNF